LIRVRAFGIDFDLHAVVVDRGGSSAGRSGWKILEVRLVPSTSTWSGAVNSNWSTAGNWDVAPTSGSDLVFPAGASNLTNTDDLGAGMAFGSLTISGSGYSISASNSSTAALTSIDSSQSTGSNTVDLPISLTCATVSVDNTGASLVLGGVISGSVGLTKAGTGKLDLTAANTYTGGTTVNAGALLIDGNQSGSAVTVASGSTMGGIKTVASIAATVGTVSPGDSAPGILIDSGDLSLGVNSSSVDLTFTVELDGTSPGNGSGNYSQLQAGGTIDLSGVSLNATLGPDFVKTLSSTYTILDNTGTSAITGTFSGIAQGSTVTISGVPFQISYKGGTNSNSVVLTEVDTSTTAVTARDRRPGCEGSITVSV